MTVPTLETERLLLVPRVAAHMDAMMEMASDPEVMRYFMSRPDEDMPAYRAKLLADVLHQDGPGLGFWSIYPKQDPDRYFGWVSLSPMPEDMDFEKAGHIELGYRLVRAAWGSGYVTEAARRILAYGFDTLGLGEIVGVVHPENLRSQAVMGRLGLVRSDDRPWSRGQTRFFYRLSREPQSAS